MHAPQYYPDYLELDKILDAQHPVSYQPGHKPAHDEMLFIVIHQAYELWFKQILWEVESVNAIMRQPSVNDNSPELQTVVHRLGRVNTILRLLVQQIDVMETMTPMDFLDFRDLLRPASGFQSWQFKILEARLGLPYQQRFGQEYYISVLKPEYAALIKAAEAEPSLLQLMAKWLERIPFFEDEHLWKGFSTSFDTAGEPSQTMPDGWKGIFFKEYRHRLAESLASAESENLRAFDQIMNTSPVGQEGGEPASSLSPAASQAALFIMLYRGYPVLQQPFQLISAVLETDDLLSTWRYRHMNMVHRMIGHRIGTGGSTGKNYLKSAADKHYIFKDFALLTSFLIERKKLPQLSKEMEERLGFVQR